MENKLSRKKNPPTKKEIELANRLRSKRLDSKLSLQEVADKIGVTKVTVSRYETLDITNIPSDKIEGMAKLYGVSPAYLMGWEDEKFEYGKRLKQLRKPSDEKYITLEELAKIFNEKYSLNINKSIISRWEENLSTPNKEQLEAYADYFNININYLLGITDSFEKNINIIENDYLQELVDILKKTNKEKIPLIKEILSKIVEMDLIKLEAYSKII